MFPYLRARTLQFSPPPDLFRGSIQSPVQQRKRQGMDARNKSGQGEEEGEEWGSACLDKCGGRYPSPRLRGDERWRGWPPPRNRTRP
jgi:hypothetical protein